jgi:hypothetical protein
MPGESEPALRARVLEEGTQLGRYTIVRRIGAGGMAELYLARSRGIGGFDKLLALKLVLPHVADDPEFIEMFLDEARLAATLDHANIAQVVDIGRVGNDHFYAMEYVHGLDLREITRGVPGPLPIEIALTIVLAVAAGLHHAHERCGHDGRPLGVVHRDVSPSNVLVTYDGVVKLVDFGIARAAARAQSTQAGVIKGKRGYMSPEQCRGDAVDRRSDVFGLGILLWELTVGQRLFGGDSDYAAMSKIVFGMVPDPRQIVPDYPPALAEIAMRALQRDAEHRPPTAQALALELEQFVQSSGLRTSNHMLAAFIAAKLGTVPQPTLVPRPAVDEEAATRHVEHLHPRARTPVWPFAIAAALVLGGAGWWFTRPVATDALPLAMPVSDATSSPAQSVESPPNVEPQVVVIDDSPLVDEAPAIDDDADPIVIDEDAPTKTRKRSPFERTAGTQRERTEPPSADSSTPGAPVPSRPNELFPPRE